MSLENIMSKMLVTVTRDDDLKVVKELFDNTRFHHLLVVESEELLGVVSDRDFLKVISPNIDALEETPEDLLTLDKKVHQIMSGVPITLHSDAGIYDAIHIFNTHDISCIPILDYKDRPVGIISWRDILKKIELMKNEASASTG